MKSIFLVGCPRSGTTLLQSMIASHSKIISFPETHFFSKTMPINPILRRLKWYGKKDRTNVLMFLNNHNYNLDPFKKSSKKYSLQQWSEQLVDVLYQMAKHDAKNSCDIEKPVCWIEKTPRHLHYISSIERATAQPKFVHILRDGKEVIASMRLATKRHPEEWDGERSLRKCIKWWNIDIKESLKYQDRTNHFFVVYQQLLTEPEKVLKPLCQFLSVNYQQKMATHFHKTADHLIAQEERWKNRNTENCLEKSKKLQQNYDESTIKYICKKAHSVDLSPFHH